MVSSVKIASLKYDGTYTAKLDSIVYVNTSFSIIDIPLAISIPNHHKLLKETQRIMMNIPTPKGKGAIENTKERILSSEVTDIPPGVNHRNQGIV